MPLRFRSLIVTVAAFVACHLAAGQISSPPPICFGFNLSASQTTPPLAEFYPPQTGGLTVHFVAPGSATVERCDLPVSGTLACYCGPALVIELYQTPALGIPPLGAPIAVFSPTGYVLEVWQSFYPPAPVSIAGGTTYAVRIRSTPPPTGGDCFGFYYDPTAAQQFPYQFAATPTCPGPLSGVFPATGQFGLIIAFRGLGCGPGPLAIVSPVGIGCGENALPGSFSALLLPSTAPAIGTTFNFSVAAPFASTTAVLFWSIGLNASGSSIAGTSPCLHYLDGPSLAALNLLGFEPLLVSPLTGGYVGWQLPVPPDPGLAGGVLGLQAMIIGPHGTLPLGGGLSGQTTSALHLLLGY